MKLHALSLLALLSAVPLGGFAQTVQFGNLDVVQNTYGNIPSDITATVAAGSSAGFSVRRDVNNPNRGDYSLNFGNADDAATGIMLGSVRQNSRDDSATGNNLVNPFQATPATWVEGTDYFLSLFHSPNGGEVNMHVAAAYFPYAKYLGAYVTNTVNNTALNTIVASPGIRLGTGLEFQNTATAGEYSLNLKALGAPSSEGVLLVNGAKNEDNYALSRPNADGTFSIWCKDNEANTTSYEADPVAFVYLPVSGVGSDHLAALGRVNSNATTDIAAGSFTVTKGGTGTWYLKIPGQTGSTGTLIVSAEWGGNGSGGFGNMLDNIVSYEWDAVNTRWIIQSRDLTNATTAPVLQDGINGDEDVFSFAFFTTSDINQPPSTELTAPAAGSAIAQSAVPLVLSATASDTDGTIAKVEFFDGTTLLGSDTTAPYSISVNSESLALGVHSLTTRATDSAGAIASSSPVSITIQPPVGAGGLFFDGVDDHVTFGNKPALGLASFTLELWFRREGAGVASSSGSGGISAIPLITKGRGENDGSNVDCNYFFGIQATTGRLAADFEDMATGLNHPANGTTVVPSGVWQHAAVTFDATKFEWRIYLNGALEATVSTNGQVPRSDSIQHSAIATAMNSTGVREGAFFGRMDEVRIWNYARTQTEIQQAINSEIPAASGLVARWAMSEGSGTVLASSTSGALNGTLVNGPSWTTGAPFNINIAPSISLTAPANGTTVLAPANFTLTADASDIDGTITQVEFLRDGQVIGTDSSAPYSWNEANLGSGVYSYAARATDNSGASVTTNAVIVTANFDPLHPPANTALRFDGVDDYVTMGTALELGMGGPPNNGMTLECWFRQEGAGVTSGSGSGGITGVPLFGKGRGESDGSTVDCDYFFGISPAGLLVADFETYPGAGLTSGQNYPITGTHTPIQTGIWYHAAVTYDGPTATWKLYLNGQPAGTATAAPNARPRFDSIQHFAIATAMNSTGVREGAFAGRIDEVRVWNYVRSAADIAADRNREIASAPGLVARYGLNEAAGTKVSNSTAIDGVTLGSPVGTIVSEPRWVEGAPFTTQNISPTVVLDTPATGATTVYPYPTTFTATPSDSDGSIARVEFYVNGVEVGEDATAPYSFAWKPTAVGPVSVFARAIDNVGAANTSAAVTLEVLPNPNQPPVVTTVSPANLATGVAASTTVSVNIADPENDGTTVTFYGRKTVPVTPGPDFTLMVLPDTQYYSENTPATRFAQFLAQTNWIVSQKDVRNIAFVSHMGDIVDDGDSIPQQWVNANQAMTILENHATTLRAYGLPFGAAPGNHDQSINGDPNSVSSYYNQYFGVSRYLGRPYWGGNYGTNNDNNYQLFSASGMDFIILHLEYRTAADPAVIAWADALLKAHPHRRAIVTSHWIIGQGNPAPFGGQGQQIYDGLKNNKNLFLLLCGHIHAEGRRADIFEGRTIYSVLSDYQGATNGGNGFLRIFTFSPANNRITVESYSPTLNRAVNSSDAIPGFEGTFTMAYDMQNSVSEWIPLGTVTVSAGGTNAQLNWTGLEKASNYEWKAEAFDGINKGASNVSRFSTASAFAPTITLEAPLSTVTYAAPATITMKADADDADGNVARVDFFVGTTKIGEDYTAPYEITAPAQAVGTYDFSAVALDNEKRATLSSIVKVTVVNRTNVVPAVTLTAPSSGSTATIPGVVALAADASDTDGAVSKVAFYADATLIGEDDTAPYSINWSPTVPGTYALTAKAYDNDNAVTTSTASTLNLVFSAAGAAADRDGDGLSALLEWSLGTSDGSAGHDGIPVLGTDGAKLTLSFLRARAEVVYTVQASDDLKNWTDLATNPGTVGASVTVIDTNTTSPARFLRLRIEANGIVVTTVPVGRLTYNFVKGQEAAVSFPLSDVIGGIAGRPAGFITGVGANFIESAGAGWTSGQLSQAQAPYLLKITSGMNAGRTFAVDTAPGSQNTASRVTLITDGVNLATLGFALGTDTFELITADTLGTLFPSGTLLSGSATTGDVLRAWDGAAWISYFHDGSSWQKQTGGNADNVLVTPDKGWMLLRRGATSSLVVLGQVSSTAAQVPVARGGSSYVSLLPVQQTFAEFPLQTLLPNWSSNPASPADGDHVKLWSGAAWLNYYYDGSAWKRQGAPANAGSTVLLKAGRPILIVRPAGAGSDSLIQNKTY
ncbi:MAG: Ig-like domain-containing protein [Nibricoccus sp.]